MLVLGFLTKWGCPLSNPQKKTNQTNNKTTKTNPPHHHKTTQYLRPQNTAQYSEKQYISNIKVKAGEKYATEKDNLGPLLQTDVFLDQMTAQAGHSCEI